MEELLADRARFTAVVCANDRLAVGAIGALKQHGRRCPQDISVTGFNDMSMVERLDPALTTVRVQHYQAGFEAAEMLVEQMRQDARKRVTREINLPVELVVRESTRRI
jgi:LacI family transcriptional regulator